jgi:predicted Zn finger-like uncharacterized protein
MIADMAIDVQCPNCGTSSRLSSDSVGGRTNCKTCGHAFTVSIALDDTTELLPAADKGGVESSGDAPPTQPVGPSPPEPDALKLDTTLDWPEPSDESSESALATRLLQEEPWDGEQSADRPTIALPEAGPSPSASAPSKRKLPVWVWIALGGLVALLLAVAVRFSTKNGTAEVTDDDGGGPIRVTVNVPRKREPKPGRKPDTNIAVSNTAPDSVPILHFEFEGNADNSGSLGRTHDGILHGDGHFSSEGTRWSSIQRWHGWLRRDSRHDAR